MILVDSFLTNEVYESDTFTSVHGESVFIQVELRNLLICLQFQGSQTSFGYSTLKNDVPQSDVRKTTREE